MNKGNLYFAFPMAGMTISKIDMLSSSKQSLGIFISDSEIHN